MCCGRARKSATQLSFGVRSTKVIQRIVLALSVNIFLISCATHGNLQMLEENKETALSYSVSEREAYAIAYTRISGELGYAPPSRSEWLWWSNTLGYQYFDKDVPTLVWTVRADLTSNGDYGNAKVIIDAKTGEILHIHTGKKH